MTANGATRPVSLTRAKRSAFRTFSFFFLPHENVVTTAHSLTRIPPLIHFALPQPCTDSSPAIRAGCNHEWISPEPWRAVPPGRLPEPSPQRPVPVPDSPGRHRTSSSSREAAGPAAPPGPAMRPPPRKWSGPGGPGAPPAGREEPAP